MVPYGAATVVVKVGFVEVVEHNNAVWVAIEGGRNVVAKAASHGVDTDTVPETGVDSGVFISYAVTTESCVGNVKFYYWTGVANVGSLVQQRR